ncbi:MAG: ergothioneine biosynthesis protein EgtB [Deltaproteobacteria bacterium]|nr:ergothioneine biosynthesis protein EgtB [Deltaproteobacteria bacterium]
MTRDRYCEVRQATEQLCAPLATEDYGVQSMADASPTKWHLAHTTWFFETFVLKPREGYRPFHPLFEMLFNSYYNSIGEPFPRPQRGLLTRPTVEDVYRYRRVVDEEIENLIEHKALSSDSLAVVELGVHHEQQHQELILTDLKHLLSCNPLRPAYRVLAAPPSSPVAPQQWCEIGGGVYEIGHAADGFAFDNETPRHRIYCEPFGLATRPVTHGEMQAFIDDDGYRRPELWLSEGWNSVCSQGWQAPLYWEKSGGEWWIFTLAGMRRLNPSEPLCHVSYFEADAYARWAGARLPREGEWEIAASQLEATGNFVESGWFHPRAASAAVASTAQQMFGDVWEWSESPYTAYPGFRPTAGALGEYNGKFMCNQFVLRGGSCATPSSHIRASYRNFFPAAARWQFSGIRLARDV